MKARAQHKEKQVGKVDWNSEKLLKDLYNSCRNCWSSSRWGAKPDYLKYKDTRTALCSPAHGGTSVLHHTMCNSQLQWMFSVGISVSWSFACSKLTRTQTSTYLTHIWQQNSVFSNILSSSPFEEGQILNYLLIINHTGKINWLAMKRSGSLKLSTYWCFANQNRYPCLTYSFRQKSRISLSPSSHVSRCFHMTGRTAAVLRRPSGNIRILALAFLYILCRLHDEKHNSSSNKGSPTLLPQPPTQLPRCSTLYPDSA